MIDLHVHTKEGSDGSLPVHEIFQEAGRRGITLLSCTDHDSIDSQQKAVDMAGQFGIRYLTGVELNVTFSHPGYLQGKSISLDLLGYQFDIENPALRKSLWEIRSYREERARRILEKINVEFDAEGRPRLTEEDMKAIAESVDGSFGRPHIADYLVNLGIVKSRREAFDKYLVKCNIPKYPLTIQQASKLIRDAHGVVILAHPNDPNGTSLRELTLSLSEQAGIIEDSILDYIDGIECWHSRNDEETTNFYVEFARSRYLILTGGSDCHQKPLIMGTVKIPDFVASQFYAVP